MVMRSRVVMLSATPIHNSPRDLTALLALFLGSRSASLSRAEIAARVAELGRELARDYDGLEPLLVAPLPSSAVFLSDLSRALPVPHRLDTIQLANYAGGLVVMKRGTASASRRVLMGSTVLMSTSSRPSRRARDGSGMPPPRSRTTSRHRASSACSTASC